MEKHDFLIIADATGSMSAYLRSLATSLPQIISISALTGCFSRIGVLAYRDYSDKTVLEWSGWLEQDQHEASQSQQPDLVKFARGLRAHGGGDYPEAAKTALAKAYEVMREDAETLIFLYTDAPPHPDSGDISGTDNTSLEKAALSSPGSYSGYGSSCVDWVSATNNIRNGPKRARIFAILDPHMGAGTSWFNYLTIRTGGSCLNIKSYLPETISKLTVDLLLAWMGVKKTLADGNEGKPEDHPADLSRYVSLDGIDNIENEKDPKAIPFISYTLSAKSPCKENIVRTRLTTDAIEKYISKKATPVQDFAKRWKSDDQYKELAVEHLLMIIENHIEAMTLNPVFGTLWRAVCSDREYPRRDEILLAFNHRLESMNDGEERAKMKTWLDESYDFAGEIVSIINSVPQADQYPCVFLDPTLSFSRPESDTETNNDITLSDLTRTELLEIGRSCNPSIIRRIGTILSRLTIVHSESDMPKHISSTTNESIAKIPLALASENYKRKFWKILFHLIKPGTMLSPRPAALVAALSLRVGIKPLQEVAAQEMLAFKDKWNELSTPETWNIGCLALLIDADDAHIKQVQEKAGHQSTLLIPSDRKLFEDLVSYKLLEQNLNTQFTAQVPWTPQKSIASVGPLVTCQGCRFPRSVTMMGENGKCGLCLVPAFSDEDEKKIRLNTALTNDSSSNASWVECFSQTCRAQYVVYNVTKLNVRPKCHYCRNGATPAPTVECTRCLNRMIWPQEYRDSTFAESEFVCPPCESGCDPISAVEVTANALSKENGFSWLIQEVPSAFELPFSNLSIFKIISNTGVEEFSRINLFPISAPTLIRRGKPIHNANDLITSLQRLVAARQTSRTSCSLCFSTFQHGTLVRACGRKGCDQRVCKECISGWYGLNTAGCVINTAALGCPFCRRYPASRTLAKHGMGIHAVQNLNSAVQDQGRMIYAWCQECHTAKELMERSCAHGPPPDLRDWACDGCLEQREARRLERERELIVQALDNARLTGVGLEEVERRRQLVELDAEQRSLKSIRPCPNCETMTLKTSGCGHMKCSVIDCGVDWCYFCGNAFDDDEIYRHMNEIHGGLFGGEMEVHDEVEDWSDTEY